MAQSFASCAPSPTPIFNDVAWDRAAPELLVGDDVLEMIHPAFHAAVLTFLTLSVRSHGGNFHEWSKWMLRKSVLERAMPSFFLCSYQDKRAQGSIRLASTLHPFARPSRQTRDFARGIVCMLYEPSRKLTKCDNGTMGSWDRTQNTERERMTRDHGYPMLCNILYIR